MVRATASLRLRSIIEPDAADAVALDRVVAYYQDTLLDTPHALEWLEKRGLADDQLLKHFRLGFCNRTLGMNIPERNRIAGAAIREQLTRLGVLRSSGHEHFRGSITVPLFGINGGTANIYGRKTRSDLRAGTAIEVTMTDGDVGVLNPDGFVEGGGVILAATVLDALTWWSSGFPKVSTLMGASALPYGIRDLLEPGILGP